MKTKYIQLSAVVFLALALSACVVAPVQPIGYRVTSTTVPVYDNNDTQSSTTVIQTTTPVYTYNSYYPYYPYYAAPTYVDPFYGVGVGLGIGIGVNYYRGGGCCWRGYRGGYRGGYRVRGGWHR